jgi:hypothetical protein
MKPRKYGKWGIVDMWKDKNGMKNGNEFYN